MNLDQILSLWRNKLVQLNTANQGTWSRSILLQVALGQSQQTNPSNLDRSGGLILRPMQRDESWPSLIACDGIRLRSVEYGELRGVGQYPSYWVIVKGENRGRPVIVRLWTYVNNECLWVQWYKYFYEVKDDMFHSTRRSRVEWNISSFTEWKYFVPLHEWENIHYLLYITCTKIQVVPDTGTRVLDNTKPFLSSSIVSLWITPAHSKEPKYHIFWEYWYTKSVPVFTNTGKFQYLGPQVYFFPKFLNKFKRKTIDKRF